MRYKCSVCGFVYDESYGIPSIGIMSGMRWEWLSTDFRCPHCRASKSGFLQHQSVDVLIENAKSQDNIYKMTSGELSALCSQLALSCKIQYLFNEAQQFTILADYYKSQTQLPIDSSIDKLLELMEDEFSNLFVKADNVASLSNDRGAKRILNWCKGATRASSSILNRYKSQGEILLQNKNVYICEICGYIHISDTMPRGCPVCRVSNIRIEKVE